MRIVTAQELESWLATGKVLEKDARGPKVVALENGLFLKIFHTRRHPILARLQPAAKRFARNVERLARFAIPAPQLCEQFWLDYPGSLSACLYQPLPGESIEQLYRRQPEQVEKLLPELAAFIRRLHYLGIYFRSLHLGNIILLPQGGFGLIDILDMQFKRGALNSWQVRRNFQHLTHYLQRHRLEDFPLDELQRHYASAPAG
ncbi:toluene tolerance protein [Pseudomonas stutzeri]|uniref:phosphotransferase n=1 Tax=Stutzerimonas stutzeri TaxID=316 RepID=UPI0019098058|nr:phosphotransferase [Stutzerimonas stutzeri]MBK3866159.1 toluene tolerance protein [Stutzerimonas stutzeri]